MSEVDRDELRRLLDEAAAPGPWWQEWVDGDEWYAVYGQPTGDLVCPEVCTTRDADDTNLLVAAVNALPGLLDALDAMEGRALAAEALVLAEKQRAEALEKAETHRDSLAATLIEVQREKLAVEAARDRYGQAHKACHEQRDAAWAAIERVRELHTPGDEWCNFHESAFCDCAGVYCEACGDSYPCPTIQALDGGGPDE